jgi:pimeloyl-ACP methyl ester carboxylesterase
MSKLTLALLAITMLFIGMFSYVLGFDTGTTQEGKDLLLIFSDFFAVTFIISGIFDMVAARKRVRFSKRNGFYTILVIVLISFSSCSHPEKVGEGTMIGVTLEKDMTPEQLENSRWLFENDVYWSVSIKNGDTINADLDVPEPEPTEPDFFTVSTIPDLNPNTSTTITITAEDSNYSNDNVRLYTSNGTLIPKSISIQNGSWVGSISIKDFGRNEYVYVSAGEGYGQSNTFDVIGSSMGNLTGEVNRLSGNSGYMVRLYDDEPNPNLSFVYESGLTISDGFSFSNISCGEYWIRLESSTGDIKSESRLVSVQCEGNSFTVISYFDFDSCDAATSKIPVLLVPGILGSSLKGIYDGAFARLPARAPRWDSGELELHNFVVGDFPGESPKIDVAGWETIREDLELQGYHRGCDIFEVPYYWADSAKSSAQNYLKPWINHALKISGKQKVDIIAHSMGGIVTRSYIQNTELYENDINKFAMVGTPNQGAPFAYLVWEEGNSIGADEFASLSNTEMLASARYSYTNHLIQFMNVKWGESPCTYGTIGNITQSVPYFPRTPQDCNKLKMKRFVHNHVQGLRDLLPTYEGSIKKLSGANYSYTENLDLINLNSLNLSRYDTIILGLFAGNTKLTLNELRVSDLGSVIYGASGGVGFDGDGTVPLISMHFPLLATANNTYLADGYHSELPNVFSTDLLGFILY